MDAGRNNYGRGGGRSRDEDELKNPELQSSSSEFKGNQMQPIKRPDNGGTLAIKSVSLLVNHFVVHFDSENTIFHYDVDVKPASSTDERLAKRTVRKSDMRVIRDTYSDDPRFDILQTVYDGEKNVFSAVVLPTGEFRVNITNEDAAKSASYIFTIRFVNELKLSKLIDYLTGCLSYVPRDILQAVDLVMKENPSGRTISVGRRFYSSNFMTDFSNGIQVYQGFQQSLRPTSQGLALCLDYAVSTFVKPGPVIEFLSKCLKNFYGVNDIKRRREEVNGVLKGLKVQVTHRQTKQKYTIAGLTDEDARDCYFDLVDPAGINPPETISLVKYFQNRWNRAVVHQNIPCLELGKNNRSNKVPIEFCVLVKGQKYDKENLDSSKSGILENLTFAKPHDRMRKINEMVRDEDGPYGAVPRNFRIGVDVNMTSVVGRVIGAPDLKLGGPNSVSVDAQKCHWSLRDRSFVDPKPIDRWALLDFTAGEPYKLFPIAFYNKLRDRCINLGMRMEMPLLYRSFRMHELSSVNNVENLLKNVVEATSSKAEGKLQLIICVLTKRDPGYRSLKWVSETKIGVVTQCCLFHDANTGQDQYFANLCLKINAKLGGNNFELNGNLPHFNLGDHVMFIGADVSHPGPMDASSPSIAAVVGTVNWPAANRYAARIRPQAHRSEKIINFGAMCLELIDTYAKLNNSVKPSKIVVFRDGVGDGQFGMLLEEELSDLKKAICECDDHYQPKITLIVAQKRHQTRLFITNTEDGGDSGNVPPGTVVDTKIVHRLDFDFYLCSHYGSVGTSKPTHYYVLWDENGFGSDELQKLIYDMCFTYVRCTKPISLVPPVRYADIVAYRGRMFQEAVMETTSSSDVSFDASLYRLHPDLENIMFFV